jgi:TRAP-type mannitol/chloroaromatic compound transport system substrate-binding protein
VEVGSGASYYWAGKEPATQWFAAVPFGLNAQGMSAWFHGSDGLKLWKICNTSSTRRVWKMSIGY